MGKDRQPPSRIPLACANLTENRLRLLASLAGTAFAVTLMFMEHGFQQSLLESMVGLIRHLDGDLIIVSRTVYTLSVPVWLPVSPARAGPGFSRRSGPRAGVDRDADDRSGGARPMACRGRSASSAIPRTMTPSTSRRSGHIATSGRGRGWRWPIAARGPGALARWRPVRVGSLGQDHAHPRHFRARRRLPERRNARHERRLPGRYLPRSARAEPRGRRRDRGACYECGRAPTSSVSGGRSRRCCRPMSACSPSRA